MVQRIITFLSATLFSVCALGLPFIPVI